MAEPAAGGVALAVADCARVEAGGGVAVEQPVRIPEQPSPFDERRVVVVPFTFNPTQGARLMAGVVVGDRISAGLQGGIFTLLDEITGAVLPRVLKWAHKRAILAPMEREWQVGRRLNALACPDGTLPGFARSGMGVRDDMGTFRGVLLERVDGVTVEKVLSDPAFADVAWVTAMLREVLGALDRAQAALGFLHADLRCANVMQAHPNTDKSRFLAIDYGLARFGETYAAGPDALWVPGTPLPPAAAAAAPGQLVDAASLDLPPWSIFESVHRAAWKRKGDVYHLLFDLGERLDGRMWAGDDRDNVERLMSLIAHVTGVRPHAWFDARPEGRVPPPAGGLGASRPGIAVAGRSTHALRRWAMRVTAWVHPRNPGLTAAEALTSPLFTGRTSWRVRRVGLQVGAGKAPWGVETA